MSYTDHEHIAETYNAAARSYADAWQEEDTLPHAKLENELVRRMLGDCTGYHIMDIGGGSGGHARQALEAGAAHVDVVDLSAGMMDAGKQMESELGRNAIGWHLADAFKPIADQVPGLPIGEYDLVLAAWPFDHAANLKEFEAIWQNVSSALKAGGRVVAVRVGSPYAESAKEGKYGSRFNNVEPINDGVKYTYKMTTNPPFTLEASSMEMSYSGSTVVPEKVGIRDIRVLDLAETDTVKADPEFWALMVKDPHFVGFTGLKG